MAACLHRLSVIAILHKINHYFILTKHQTYIVHTDIDCRVSTANLDQQTQCKNDNMTPIFTHKISKVNLVTWHFWSLLSPVCVVEKSCN